MSTTTVARHARAHRQDRAAAPAHADLTESEKTQLRAIVLAEIEQELTFRGESARLNLGNVRDYFAPNPWVALAVSVVFAGLALSATGVAVSVLSRISLKRKGLELVIGGFAAAAIAYVIGWALKSITGIDV